MSRENKERIEFYFAELLKDGRSAEHARHSLMELGESVLPYVLEKYMAVSDELYRAELVHIAWNTRSQSALHMLSIALLDSSAAVWKEALRGVVALNLSPALEVLATMRTTCTGRKLEYIEEAMEQLADNKSSNQ